MEIAVLRITDAGRKTLAGMKAMKRRKRVARKERGEIKMPTSPLSIPTAAWSTCISLPNSSTRSWFC
jgi:hypothetical protein